MLCLVAWALPAPNASSNEERATQIAPAEGPFADCEGQLAAEPDSREASACFYAISDRRDEAEARLRSHLAARPDSPWLHYYLGNVLWSSRDPVVADHYRTAARLLAARGEHAGETDAWVNLASYLRQLGDRREASAALDGAVHAARASGDEMLAAKVEIERARQALGPGSDLIAIYRDLRRIERIAFPDGPYALRRDCLDSLGQASTHLGRWDEASEYWSRYRDLVRERGDRFGEAFATYSLANAILASRPHDAAPERALTLFRDALQVAEEAGNATVVALSHRVLGRLLDGPESKHHIERCVEIAETTRQTSELPICLGALALATVDEDPVEARRLIDRALALSLEAGSPWPMVYSWLDRMTVQWKTLPREEALADSLAALEIIEALRGLQTSESGRVGVGSVWSEAYFWLAGRLFDSEPTPREIAVAFGLGERARARTLLETLTPADQPAAGPHPEHRRVLEEMVSVHRRLLDPRLTEDDRQLAMTRLEELETEEATLREAAGMGALGNLEEEDFVDLAEIEALVAPGQAVLAFQVGLWKDIYGEFDGGAWLLAITSRGTSVHRIPDRRELESAVRIFLGLIERRDGAEQEAAAALYDRLLGAALDELPGGIDQLVLVPDGPLHLLPFGALRQGPRQEPLAGKYRLSRAPSATLWARWKRSPADSAPAAALVFADPSPARGESAAPRAAIATEREATFARGETIGRLPHARREGRTIARTLGGETVVLMGDEASEARLKQTVGGGAQALHFAAHALVDGENPGRSAVVLAPGSESEDGLLQPREIAALELGDRLVVLSACRGATGAVLQGEGAMSLARAFFQAGARTVVAALWPLRDDDTRALAGQFYTHLAAGVAIDEALARAQREMIDEGYPAAAWAGLVVLGDGAWQPFDPVDENGLAAIPLAGWIAGLIALGLALVWLRVWLSGRSSRRRT